VGAAVNYNPYTLSFAPYFAFGGFTAASDQASPYPSPTTTETYPNVTLAALINRANRTVLPTASVCIPFPGGAVAVTSDVGLVFGRNSYDLQTVQSAMADFSFNQSSTLDITWPPGPNSWPISTYFHLIALRNYQVDCLAPTNLAEFVYWILLSSRSVADVNFLDRGEPPVFPKNQKRWTG